MVHAWIMPLQYVTAGLWFCTSGWPTLSGVWKGSGFKFGAAQKSRAKSKPAFQNEVDSKPGPLKTKGSATRKFKFKGSATRHLLLSGVVKRSTSPFVFPSDRKERERLLDFKRGFKKAVLLAGIPRSDSTNCGTLLQLV